MPLHIRLRNPYVASAELKQEMRYQPREAIDRYTDELKALGHDGVVLPYRDGAEVVVFDPADVRSTTAMFDPERDGENGLRLNIRRVLEAASGRDNTHVSASIGRVSVWLAARARDAGVEISGFDHVVDTSAARHVRKNHGDAKSEAARGQIAVTEEDLLAIPDILDAPDVVVFGRKTRLGRDQIVYLKKMPDGSTLYLEEVRNGRRQMAAVSMRRYPPAMNADRICQPSIPTPETTGVRLV